MAIIKHGNNALANITAFPSAVSTGKPVLISTATASSSASIEFTSGIDSTYDIYQFEFIDIHPGTNGIYFQMNLSIDGGSNYNVTKTSSAFESIHTESDSIATLRYSSFANADLAQSTANQDITEVIPTASGEDDMCATGNMYLFNPSSTTFVKHYITNFQQNSDGSSNYSWETFKAGYANTTSAVNAIKFVMSSGNIDAGTIKMYGISA
jgi:hypothetical protein